MKNDFINIDNFSCGYSAAGFKTCRIDIDCIKGSFTGILGKNGSGKSTLFKGLIGDITIFSGNFYINNNSEKIDLTKLSAKKKAQLIAIVSQFIELAPITVEEYVLIGRTPYKKPFQFSYTDEDRNIAEKYMELTGITHLRDKLVTEISGGEQQMVNIASALTQQPQLLLLDEPTSHLDITYQLKIMDLLQMLNNKENLTVIMIIHDLNLAAEYCSNIILMRKGEAIHKGTPDEVLTSTNIEETFNTKALIATNPISKKPFVFPYSKETRY